MAGAAAGAGQLLTGASQAANTLFGSDASGRASGTSATKGTSTTREGLVLDQVGIEAIIADVLGGANGLADIFAAEQGSGIFNSSVAAQAAGDLASKLAGEIAKIQGETVSTTTEEGSTESESTQETSEEGLVEGLFDGGAGSGLLDAAVTFGTGGLNKVFGF